MNVLTKCLKNTCQRVHLLQSRRLHVFTATRFSLRTFLKGFCQYSKLIPKNWKIDHKLGEQFDITIGGISPFVTTVKTQNSSCTRNSCVPGVCSCSEASDRSDMRFFIMTKL